MNILANLEYYKVFSLVAKEGSMKTAAEMLYVSQPAITKTIKTLENQLGGTLFIRSNKGLKLTQEGQELLDKVNRALEIIQDGETEFQNKYELNNGEIRIGVSAVLTKILLIDKIKEFNDKYPNIKITIVNGLTPLLLSELYSGKLDVVIFNEGGNSFSNLSVNKIGSLRYGFVYNPEIYTDINSIEDVKKYSLLVQKEPSFTREFFERYVNENGLEFKNKIEVVSQDLIREFVKAGLGIGFMYVDIADNGMSVINTDEILTDVYIAENKNTVQTRAVKEFIKLFD